MIEEGVFGACILEKLKEKTHKEMKELRFTYFEEF